MSAYCFILLHYANEVLKSNFLKNGRWTIFYKTKIIKYLKLITRHLVKRAKRNNQLLLCEAPKRELYLIMHVSQLQYRQCRVRCACMYNNLACLKWMPWLQPHWGENRSMPPTGFMGYTLYLEEVSCQNQVLVGVCFIHCMVLKWDQILSAEEMNIPVDRVQKCVKSERISSTCHKTN